MSWSPDGARLVAVTKSSNNIPASFGFGGQTTHAVGKVIQVTNNDLHTTVYTNMKSV